MLFLCKKSRKKAILGFISVFILRYDNKKSFFVFRLDYFVDYIFLGVPLRVGLYRASLRYGASTSLNRLPLQSLTRFATRTSHSVVRDNSIFTELKILFGFDNE